MNQFIPYQQAIEKIDRLQAEKEDFIFVLNFNKTFGFCEKIVDLDTHLIKYEINQKIKYSIAAKSFTFKYKPIPYSVYLEHFNQVKNQISLGNTYLANLTFKTEIETNLNLLEIFKLSKAKYKLWIKDQFVVFSPECFIQINEGKISTFPMKGTHKLQEGEKPEILLENPKENAEHLTIVDLLRNDLSMVATNVKVNNFKYLDQLNTNNGIIVQMSSEISGNLKEKYLKKYGTLLDLILPAGSVSGAPKARTLEIIHEAEDYDREYYTGVFGIFSNGKLDSGIMIRFIEEKNDQLFFKSGGGITYNSDPQLEYQEYMNKIYVPIF
ncbi:MAG TPA: aminodeoxychorismate synthase component I [Saprospiraceae bacterium]|nr:aminodeoxychorismate synthase component I [Saprospiraceae bacterium]